MPVVRFFFLDVVVVIVDVVVVPESPGRESDVDEEFAILRASERTGNGTGSGGEIGGAESVRELRIRNRMTMVMMMVIAAAVVVVVGKRRLLM